MRSEIQTAKDGGQILVCFYEGNRWDEAITEARRRHGYESKPITVLAFPESGRAEAE